MGEGSGMKKLVVAWVGGFVFAMALVVRWQLIGNPTVAPGNAAPGADPTDESESLSEAPAGVPWHASAGWEAVRVGARTDLSRLRKLLKRTGPDTDPVPDPAVDAVDLTTNSVSATAG